MEKVFSRASTKQAMIARVSAILRSVFFTFLSHYVSSLLVCSSSTSIDLSTTGPTQVAIRVVSSSRKSSTSRLTPPLDNFPPFPLFLSRHRRRRSRAAQRRLSLSLHHLECCTASVPSCATMANTHLDTTSASDENLAFHLHPPSLGYPLSPRPGSSVPMAANATCVNRRDIFAIPIVLHYHQTQTVAGFVSQMIVLKNAVSSAYERREWARSCFSMNVRSIRSLNESRCTIWGWGLRWLGPVFWGWCGEGVVLGAQRRR